MAGETVITVVGNLTADPELRFTQSGKAVAAFTVASTPRVFDRESGQWKEGSALFLRCQVWEGLADNVTESLSKGMRVIVQGRLVQRSYETREGERRTVVELQVDEVGPSLKWARAQVVRNRPQGSSGQASGDAGGQPSGGHQGQSWAGSNGSQCQGQGYGAGQGPAEDPWGREFSEEPPF